MACLPVGVFVKRTRRTARPCGKLKVRVRTNRRSDINNNFRNFRMSDRFGGRGLSSSSPRVRINQAQEIFMKLWNFNLRLPWYEGGLKSFRPNKDTRHFFRHFLKIFQHSLLVTLHTSPGDGPIPVTRPNSTRRFSLQNNCSRRCCLFI